jgi:hypothetical protein
MSVDMKIYIFTRENNRVNFNCPYYCVPNLFQNTCVLVHTSPRQQEPLLAAAPVEAAFGPPSPAARVVWYNTSRHDQVRYSEEADGLKNGTHVTELGQSLNTSITIINDA